MMKTNIISTKNILGILSVAACIFWIAIELFMATKNFGLTPYIFMFITVITCIYLWKTKFYSAKQVKVSGLSFYKTIIIIGNLGFVWFVLTLLKQGELDDTDGYMLLSGMLFSIVAPCWYLFVNERKA